MKTMKLFLLLGVGLLSGTATSAQTDNKYLDDAYYRRSDLQKIDKEARRQAEIRRAAERAEREAWEKEQATLIANYKKKQADREIDAYNGHLALPEYTITAQGAASEDFGCRSLWSLLFTSQSLLWRWLRHHPGGTSCLHRLRPMVQWHRLPLCR